MPTFTFQAPDGRHIDIEAADQDTAFKGAQEWASQNPKQDTRPASFGLGVQAAAMHGLDRAAQGLEAGAKAIGVPTDAINRGLGMPSANEAASANQQALANNPNRPSIAGQIAGTLVAGAPLAAISRNPAVVGAMAGPIFGQSDNPVGAGIEAAAGALSGWGVNKILGGVAGAVRPLVGDAAVLAKSGVKLTPGQARGGKAMVREDKLMSRPIVGPAIAADRQASLNTFNTATVNRALEPLGVSVPAQVKPGFDAVSYAHRAVSDAYDKVIPNLSVQLNGQAFIDQLRPAIGSLQPAQRTQLQSILSTQLRNGQLAGRTLKDAQGEIRRLATAYGQDASADARELGRALWAADDILSGEMAVQNPQWAPALQKTNQAFKGLAVVEDAASRGDNGIFATGQLKQAVRRADSSRRKAASAQGDAYMQDWSNSARNVLPAQTANSGTADRLLAGNPISQAKGALSLGAYRAIQQGDRLRHVLPSATSQRVADLIERLKGPAALGLIGTADSRGN